MKKSFVKKKNKKWVKNSKIDRNLIAIGIESFCLALGADKLILFFDSIGLEINIRALLST